MNIGELGERIRKSTVVIRTSGGQLPQGSGSGVIWDLDGRIVTNAHVATTPIVEVEYWDQRRFRGEVLERDGLRDLALIKTLPSGAPALSIRATPAPQNGETAVAVGNPLGFVGALSTGKVLGLRGAWLAAQIRLAPGNSGGPLADEEGRLLGINSMVTSQGLALAVPTADVVHFIRHGAPPRLGVSVRPIPVQRNSETVIGLEILDIENASPAQAASLRIGDILLEDGPSLQSKLRSGTVAKIRFLRGNQTQTREVAIPPTHRVLS
jgi:serine protease Do